MNYTTQRLGSIRLLPPDHHRDAWQSDFQAMQGVMFFGAVPEFDKIMEVVRDFEQLINSTEPDDEGRE